MSGHCVEPCLGGCDLGCERRATWRPVPGRFFVAHGPGSRVEHDGQGGGVLFRRSRSTMRWVRAGSFVPFTGDRG